MFGKKKDDGKITVVAQIRAKSGHEAEVRGILATLQTPSLKEPGCIRYDIFEDVHYPGSFFTVEEWDAESSLDTHLTVNKEGLNNMKALLREDLRISVLRPVA